MVYIANKSCHNVATQKYNNNYDKHIGLFIPLTYTYTTNPKCKKVGPQARLEPATTTNTKFGDRVRQ